MIAAELLCVRLSVRKMINLDFMFVWFSLSVSAAAIGFFADLNEFWDALLRLSSNNFFYVVQDCSISSWYDY